jgi:hypothetical protein
MTRIAIALVIALAPVAATGCEISLDCAHGRAIINGKSFPIVCGRQTGRGIESGSIGSLIHANGRWRPGLVRPGTPMITTRPQLCYDCFIHISAISGGSNGCVGTTVAGFNAFKACSGSPFSIARR